MRKLAKPTVILAFVLGIFLFSACSSQNSQQGEDSKPESVSLYQLYSVRLSSIEDNFTRSRAEALFRAIRFDGQHLYADESLIPPDISREKVDAILMVLNAEISIKVNQQNTPLSLQSLWSVLDGHEGTLIHLESLEEGVFLLVPLGKDNSVTGQGLVGYIKCGGRVDDPHPSHYEKGKIKAKATIDCTPHNLRAITTYSLSLYLQRWQGFLWQTIAVERGSKSTTTKVRWTNFTVRAPCVNGTYRALAQVTFRTPGYWSLGWFSRVSNVRSIECDPPKPDPPICGDDKCY